MPPALLHMHGVPGPARSERSALPRPRGAASPVRSGPSPRELGLHVRPGCVRPLAGHGHLGPVTAAATGRSGWSWPEPWLR